MKISNVANILRTLTCTPSETKSRTCYLTNWYLQDCVNNIISGPAIVGDLYKAVNGPPMKYFQKLEEKLKYEEIL